MSDYGPQITAARLYRKTSKSGATYFTGRLGLMKAALLKSKEIADDGSEIWNLVLSEAPAKAGNSGRPADAKQPAKASRPTRHPPPDDGRKVADEAGRPFDDPLPFLAA